MIMKSHAKFEEKLTCCLENDMKNLANFRQNTWKSQIGTFMGSFCPKKKMHELKIYRGVMCNDTEEWWKIWRGIDLSFQNWHKEFDKFWIKHWKVSKIYTLVGCLWPKCIMFELKKYRGAIFHDTIEWCKIWRKADLCFGKWHEEFSKFLQEQTKVSKLGLLLKMYELKIYRGIMCYDNDEWCKIWKEIDLSVQNWHEKFNKFWP